MIKIKEFFQKSISLILGVAIISLALSFWVKAWTEPQEDPTAGNIESPLNVGNTGQTKTGWLSTLKSLWVGQDPGALGDLYPGVLQVLNGALINSNGASTGLIVATGSVAIGTTSPSTGFRMEVKGNIKLSDDPKIPGTEDFTITIIKSPIQDSDVATKAYVDNLTSGGSCSMRLKFAGYTTTTNGNLQGPRGAQLSCAVAFPALNNKTNHVHWCSAKELNDLGSSYPFTYEVWVRDAVQGLFAPPGICGGYITVYGGAGYATSTLDEDDSTCQAWLRSNAGFNGPVIKTTGGLTARTCNNTRRLPCCYSGN
jgi:hypothetical protein